MTAGLKPYAAMKDSGVPWLNGVPESWAVVRSKRIFTPRTELARPDDIQLSATQAYGVIPQADYERSVGRKIVRILQHLEKRRHVEVDDFVISMRRFQGGLERAWARGCIRSSYVVLYGVKDLNVAYYGYLFKSSGYIRALQSTADFIRDGQDLNFANFCAVDLPFPPLSEQAAIVRFLDYADRRIRRYIGAKQKLIKVLEEQKQAIIHSAVTHGLDLNIRLKSSGVESLGDVPEHWKVRAFTRCAIERADYRGATPTKTEAGVFLVTARNVRKGWIDYEVSREFVAESEYATIMRRGFPKLGDLLLTMEAPLGNAALVDREDIALAQRVVRFRFAGDVLDPRFVLLSVLSPYFQNQLLRRGTGSTALGIKASKLPQLQLLIPPLTEQKALLEHIDRQCRPFDVAGDKAKAEMTLLANTAPA